MRRGSGISILLGLIAFVAIGLFTKDWTTAAAIGLALAGFGGAGLLASLGRMRGGRGGTTIPGGTDQGPRQQPKPPGRSNEL